MKKLLGKVFLFRILIPVSVSGLPFYAYLLSCGFIPASTS